MSIPGVTLPAVVAVPGAGGGPARPGHPSRWRGRAKYTRPWGPGPLSVPSLSPRCPPAIPTLSPGSPQTFLLAGEGHEVLALLGLQRLPLQVLQERVPVQGSRGALLGLVALPQPRGQQDVLGTPPVSPPRGPGGQRDPPAVPAPTSGSISASSASSCASSSGDSSCRILSSSMSRYFSSSCRYGVMAGDSGDSAGDTGGTPGGPLRATPCGEQRLGTPSAPQKRPRKLSPGSVTSRRGHIPLRPSPIPACPQIPAPPNPPG